MVKVTGKLIERFLAFAFSVLRLQRPGPHDRELATVQTGLDEGREGKRQFRLRFGTV